MFDNSLCFDESRLAYMVTQVSIYWCCFFFPNRCCSMKTSKHGKSPLGKGRDSLFYWLRGTGVVEPENCCPYKTRILPSLPLLTALLKTSISLMNNNVLAPHEIQWNK